MEISVKPEEERSYCQYRRRGGDDPGWCEESDHPCDTDLGEECGIKKE